MQLDKKKIMKIFKDKTAIVTGGASGIGQALCRKLGEYGAIVTVADINEIGARETAKQITARGGRAKAVRLDVTRQGDIVKLFRTAAEKHGSLDYVFNNAGISIIGDERDKTWKDWERIININFNGVLWGTIAAYEIMSKQRSGHIINTSSMAGFVPAPTQAAYGCTKHAIVGLSVSLRIEAADLGVKVSVVCPGVVDTPHFDNAAMIKVAKEEVMKSMPEFIRADAGSAAMVILRGVKKNRPYIIFPFHSRAAWWIGRILPTALDIWARYHMKNFRKYRAAT